MYKIIYMKADYEPWWQFDGREACIISTTEYETEDGLDKALHIILENFRQAYDNEQSKNGHYFAFWSEDECEYCEACDEDAQIFHGIIVQKSANKSSISN